MHIFYISISIKKYISIHIVLTKNVNLKSKMHQRYRLDLKIYFMQKKFF